MRALVLILALAGCSGGLGALTGFLGGGGPNIAANVQAGKENEQGINTDISETRTIVRPKGRAEVSESQVRADSARDVTVNQVPPWVILLLIVGWVLPSPGEMLRSIGRAFKRG